MKLLGGDNPHAWDYLSAMAAALGSAGFGRSGRSDIAAVQNPTAANVAFLGEAGREGLFRFDTTDLSAQVAADVQQGLLIAPGSQSGLSASGAQGAWRRIGPQGILCARHFGVKGDGATDDTTAINNMTSFAAYLGGGKMLFDAGVHVVGHLTAPARSSLTSGFVPLEYVGASHPSMTFGTIGSSSMGTGGTIWKSTLADGGSIYRVLPAGGTTGFSSYQVIYRNLLLRVPDNPNIHGIDATWAQQLTVENVMCDTGVYGVASTQPTHQVYGIITPIINNGALNRLLETTVSGFYYGLQVNEHTYGDYLTFAQCLYAMEFKAANHASYFGRVGVYSSQNGLLFTGGTHAFDIAQYDTEHAASGWFTYAKDVVDPSNYGLGNIRWWEVLQNSGIENNFTKTGGTGITTTRIGAAFP